MARSFQSFEQFWPYYLGEHARWQTRAMHIAGTLIALACFAGAILYWRVDLIIAGLVAAYGLAWVGHFVFEENGPAAFGHPLWSVRGDLRMVGLWLTGNLAAELEKLGHGPNRIAEVPKPALPPPKQSSARRTAEENVAEDRILDDKLSDALADTFPGSDPVALENPLVNRRARNRS